MKKQLLGALESLEPESIDTAGMLIEALATVTNNVEEVSTASQVNVCMIRRCYFKHKQENNSHQIIFDRKQTCSEN